MTNLTHQMISNYVLIAERGSVSSTVPEETYCCNNFKKFKDKGEIFDRRVGTDLKEPWWEYTIMTKYNFIPLFYCPFCGKRLVSTET